MVPTRIIHGFINNAKGSTNITHSLVNNSRGSTIKSSQFYQLYSRFYKQCS